MMGDLIEDCPICKEHTLNYGAMGFPTCTNPKCGWWPVSMPYNDEDIERGIKAYEEANK